MLKNVRSIDYWTDGLLVVLQYTSSATKPAATSLKICQIACTCSHGVHCQWVSWRKVYTLFRRLYNFSWARLPGCTPLENQRHPLTDFFSPVSCPVYFIVHGREYRLKEAHASVAVVLNRSKAEFPCCCKQARYAGGAEEADTQCYDS